MCCHVAYVLSRYLNDTDVSPGHYIPRALVRESVLWTARRARQVKNHCGELAGGPQSISARHIRQTCKCHFGDDYSQGDKYQSRSNAGPCRQLLASPAYPRAGVISLPLSLVTFLRGVVG